MITLLCSFLVVGFFSFGSGYVGDEDLHRELSRKAEEQNWQIITGGNEVYVINIKSREKTSIMTIAEQSKYVWSAAALSSDGAWLALERGSKRLPYKTDIVLINWRKFLQSSKSFRELVQLPLPDLHVDGFTWAPDKHSLAIKARKISNEDEPGKPKHPFKVYEFSLETEELRELPIEQINALAPHAWSASGLLVYKSDDNTIKRHDAKELGQVLPVISNLAMFDFNSGKVTSLFLGRFPSWNHKGLMTYMESPKEDLAVLAPPKVGSDEGHRYRDHYYIYNPETGEQKLFLKNKHPRGKNGSIFSPITWSPDDQYILYGRQTGLTGSFDDLYVMEVATGRETLICRGVDVLYAGHASWVAIDRNKRASVLRGGVRK